MTTQIQGLELAPRGADQWGTGTNMTAGVINDYADSDLASHSYLLWKGADNQATTLTGIDSTGVSAGDIKIFMNLSESGIDDGQVILRHQDTGSAAANRIVCPGGYDFVLPIFGSVLMHYGTDSRWHVVSQSGWSKKAITQSLHLYPALEVGQVSALTGTYNDWNPTGDNAILTGSIGFAGSNLKFDDHSLIHTYVNSGGATVTGLHQNGETLPSDWGPLKFILNHGPGNLTLSHLGAGSSAANRINMPNSVDVVLAPGESIMLVHPYILQSSGGTSQWWCLASGKSASNVLSLVNTGRTTTQALFLHPTQAPATLASVPTITHDLDPGGTATIVNITAHANGSILGGLKPADATSAGRGEIRVLKNTGNGPLILIDEDASSSAGYRFALPNTMPYQVVPPGGAITVFKADTDFWNVMSPQEVGTAARPLFITPSVLAASNVNDYAPTDATTGMPGKYVNWWRVQGQVGTILTGIDSVTSPTGQNAGKRLLLTNFGSGMTLAHDSASSVSANRIWCPGNVNFVLHPSASAWLIYDLGNSKWMVEGAHDGGA